MQEYERYFLVFDHHILDVSGLLSAIPNQTHGALMLGTAAAAAAGRLNKLTRCTASQNAFYPNLSILSMLPVTIPALQLGWPPSASAQQRQSGAAQGSPEPTYTSNARKLLLSIRNWEQWRAGGVRGGKKQRKTCKARLAHCPKSQREEEKKEKKSAE